MLKTDGALQNAIWQHKIGNFSIKTEEANANYTDMFFTCAFTAE